MGLPFRYFLTNLIVISSKHIRQANNDLRCAKFAYREIPLITARQKSSFHCVNAISALNSLQSNAATLEIIRKNRNKTLINNVESAQKYLERIELEQDDLKKLNIIHVSGTKGKGSTCAFVESILHEHGYKVGFYSSPHLVVARERIRIGKKIISEKIFTDNFWDVYELLKIKQSYDGDMPGYFKFLTLLAFRIFLKEKVDVAIIEVGIGGENDCTNVIRNPVVCGITSLDLDHTAILGNNIESIAWQKAGIIKNGVPAFTVDHCPSSLIVIRERAAHKNSPLLLVPQLMKYSCFNDESNIQLGLDGAVQLVNASLALQLSRYWMMANGGNKEIKMIDDCHAEPFELSETYLSALKNVSWPGRSQVIQKGSFTYFIDGAHTMTSIAACVDWFKEFSKAQLNKISPFKILIFYITGDRDPISLMQPLLSLEFDLAIFTTNMITESMDASSDQKTVGVTELQQVEKCRKLKNIWDSINDKDVTSNGHKDKKIIIAPSITFPYIQNAINWLSDANNLGTFGYQDDSCVQILVTGSMHLVGGILAVIDPEMTCLENPLNVGPILKQINGKNGFI